MTEQNTETGPANEPDASQSAEHFLVGAVRISVPRTIQHDRALIAAWYDAEVARLAAGGAPTAYVAPAAEPALQDAANDGEG